MPVKPLEMFFKLFNFQFTDIFSEYNLNNCFSLKNIFRIIFVALYFISYKIFIFFDVLQF